MHGEFSSVLRFIDAADRRIAFDEFSPREREVLNTVNARVAAAKSLNEVMDFLFDAFRSICPCDRLSLILLEDNGERAVSHWLRTSYDPVFLKEGYVEDLSKSSLRLVLSEGKPRIISDLAAYLAEHPDSRPTQMLVSEGIRSSMTCALTVEGRPVGFLIRSSRKPYAFGYHQLRLHYQIAERLSQAVEKVFQIETLTNVNRAYLEVVGFISHELKNPLSSIVLDGKLLLDGYLGQLEPAQRERVSKVVSKAQFLISLIREYLDLARIEGGELPVHPLENVDFAHEIADPAIELVHAQIEEQKIQLTREIPADLRVQCDPDLVRVAVINLLSNAVKYGNPGGEVRISAKLDNGALDIEVYNEGPGWPESERTNLYRKFSRLQTPELRRKKGTGVGLYTVWRIISLHGGKVDAASEHGKWAKFMLLIPQPLRCELPQTEAVKG